MVKNKTRVLFLCTGNSARSQMAEGFLKALGGSRLTVSSAGTAPVGVNPLAIKAMAEVGIDISSHTSDAVSSDLLANIDLLITLCGDARESCSVVPTRVEKRHWALEDPARAEGTEQQKLEKFREIRDQIKSEIEQLVSE
ncbi:MAG: arsenate reductase ArsC [Bacillota bacterium]